MRKIYLIGSLRNPSIPDIANHLRSQGHEVFDDWFAPGPQADDWWKMYEQTRGRKYKEALSGFAAQHIFEFDKYHIDRCDTGVLVLPAGRSGHLELGYMLGQGKDGFIILDPTVDRWDLMYQFATGVYDTMEELCESLTKRN
jgi:nucleoside 2-deoxyribosyltransferase